MKRESFWRFHAGAFGVSWAISAGIHYSRLEGRWSADLSLGWWYILISYYRARGGGK
jgi:hypothetical protein